MSNITLICVSPRHGSSSAKVTKYFQNLITAKGHTVQTQTFENLEIRSIGAGYIQPNEVTPQQQAILDSLKWADKVVWVTPEYNRGVPAEMIAFIEHFGEKAYDYIWTNKIHAFVGVSSGIGGRDAVYYLGKVFGYVIANCGNGNCFVSPHMFQAINSGDFFDEQGNFNGDERYAANADKFVTKLLS